MDYKPLVSIVTVVYNGERFIEHAIKSVLGQTYPNIEYIIIDGGSTDSTLNIIKSYESRLAFWVSEKDKGISDAFNKGIKFASGQYVGLLNADDWYEPDTIENAVRNFENHDIVYGDLRLWKEDEVDFVLHGNHRFLLKEMTVNHPTVFVKKEWYVRYGLFDQRYRCAMDYDLLLRFYSKGARFKYVSAVMANMRWFGLSDSQWKLGCKETLQIKNTYYPKKRVLNYLYFLKHMMAIGLPKMLEKYHLNALNKFYRAKFSRVKKTY